MMICASRTEYLASSSSLNLALKLPFDTLFPTKAIRQSNKKNCHRKFGMNYSQSGHHIMEQLCILTTEGILNPTCLNNTTASIFAVLYFNRLKLPMG